MTFSFWMAFYWDKITFVFTKMQLLLQLCLRVCRTKPKF